MLIAHNTANNLNFLIFILLRTLMQVLPTSKTFKMNWMECFLASILIHQIVVLLQVQRHLPQQKSPIIEKSRMLIINIFSQGKSCLKIFFTFLKNSSIFSLPLDLNPSESQRPSQVNQAVIHGGDRAFEYDYTDYDLYAYDDEETEKLKKEHQLQMELQSILDQMNSMNTTTETPLPTAVSLISFT